MPSSTVDKIKERLDIVEVIGSYVKLQKAGRHYKGISPFTSEKTPSFFVSPEKGLFYCFSSGRGGDIFTFVQEMDGVDFEGALKILAERAGVPLVYESQEKRSERDRLYVVLEEAVRFFEKNFNSSTEAQKYIENRGVQMGTVRLFRIGYAPDAWRNLYEFLLAKKYTTAEIARVGLIKKGESVSVQRSGEENFYDTFRDRIIFPIKDTAGRIIAFSGRVLHTDNKGPKYLNSPDSLFFNKSETLYGLNIAKTAIRKMNFAVLVEGQMDLCLSHQVGVTNTVATSGTALTTNHLKILQKVSNRIIMAFDPDNAGVSASLRGADLALSLGMEIKVASLPSGNDPADLIRKNSQEWIEALKNSQHLIDFYLEKIVAASSSPRSLGNDIKNKLLPYIRLLHSAIEQSHFIQKISDKTGIKESALWEDLKKAKVHELSMKTKPSVKELRLSPSDFLMGAYFLLEEETSKKLSEEIRDKIVASLGEKKWEELYDTALKKKEILLIKTAELYDGGKIKKSDADCLVTRVLYDFLKNEYENLGRLLKEAEKGDDEEVFQEILKKCFETRKTIDALGREL
ncbi:MAG: DNA primase [Candidatus Pacebacteria bacterium]|nr:DNA primase [Candidatus Paceibacterota bacterium]